MSKLYFHIMFQHPRLVLWLEPVVMMVDISVETRILTVQSWDLEGMFNPPIALTCPCRLLHFTAEGMNSHRSDKSTQSSNFLPHIGRYNGRDRWPMTKMNYAKKSNWILCCAWSHTESSTRLWSNLIIFQKLFLFFSFPASRLCLCLPGQSSWSRCSLVALLLSALTFLSCLLQKSLPLCDDNCLPYLKMFTMASFLSW